MKVKLLSRVQLFVTLRTVTCQAPLSTGFSRHEHWSGLPFPTPKDLPDSETESASLTSPALTGRFFTTEPSENKASKDKLTMQFGDTKLKLFLVYHSENPKAFTNIATGSLSVVWRRNPKM